MCASFALVGLAAPLAGCSNSGEAFTAVDDRSSSSAEYVYKIPPGAGADLELGKQLDIMPASLSVKVGDVLELINDDDQGHLVGPFFVGAHESVRQRFTSPGQFIGTCSVNSSGEIVLTVTP